MYKFKSRTNKSSVEITKCNKTIFKILQKQCYNFLLNKYSIFIVTGLLVLLILLIVINVTEIFEPNNNLKIKTDVDDDDIESIDAVYTWVNGSDLKHIKALKEFKESLKKISTISNNSNNNVLVYQKVEFKTYYQEIKANYKEGENLNKSRISSLCFYY